MSSETHFPGCPNAAAARTPCQCSEILGGLDKVATNNIEFPTPEELIVRQKLEAAPKIQNLKFRVLEKMKSYIEHSVLIVSLKEDDSQPVVQAVIEALAEKGWKADYKSDQRDGSWLEIRKKQNTWGD